MRVTLDTNQLIRALMRPPQLATFIKEVGITVYSFSELIKLLDSDKL